MLCDGLTATVWCVYEGCEGARELHLRQTCVTGVLWDAVITGGKVPRRRQAWGNIKTWTQREGRTGSMETSISEG